MSKTRAFFLMQNTNQNSACNTFYCMKSEIVSTKNTTALLELFSLSQIATRIGCEQES